MKKEEVVRKLAEQYGNETVTLTKMRSIVNSMLDIMSDALIDDGVVELFGFGKIMKQKYAARPGHNPATGAACWIKSKNVVRFKAYTKLLRNINRED